MKEINLPTPYELFGVEVDKGWMPLVTPILERIEQLNRDGARIQITQIKEKFGVLCVYTNNEPKEIEDMIRDAETKSLHICEHCGAPATRFWSATGWIYTLCPQCMKELQIQYKCDCQLRCKAR